MHQASAKSLIDSAIRDFQSLLVKVNDSLLVALLVKVLAVIIQNFTSDSS
jgi:hypothetical protein